MPQPSSRDKFIEAGLRLLPRVGFTATGLQDIIDEGGAPKGSFYNYFASKEGFAIEVIDRYTETFAAIANRNLGNSRKTPLARLHAYFKELIAINEEKDWSEGCLLGNLGQEIAAQNEPVRKRIDVALRLWRSALAECIREGQALGEIRKDIPAEALADVSLSAWEGALLRMRIQRGREPLDHFVKAILGTLLPAARS